MSTVQIDSTPVRNESTLRKKLRRKQNDFLRKLRKQEAKHRAVADAENEVKG